MQVNESNLTKNKLFAIFCSFFVKQYILKFIDNDSNCILALKYYFDYRACT